MDDHEAWDDELGGAPVPLAPDPLDRTAPVAMERTRRPTARLGLSVPGAVGGVLLIGAIAFGANLGLAGSRSDGDGPGASHVAVATGGDAKPAKPQPTTASAVDGDTDAAPTAKAAPTAEPTKQPEPTKKPTPEPTKQPTPEPTKKPEAKPTAKPEPKPTQKPADKPVLEIAVAIKEGTVLVKWSACDVDGADYYKVVRSTDSTVAWPAGDGDTLVGAVEMGGTLKAWDGDAPDGKKVWYRVFCVRHTEGGYKVLSASGAKSVVAPASTPKPTPKPTPEVTAMWIEAGVEGGNVVVHWEACGSDVFSHYRIVRKVDGEGGVIAEIDDAGATTYVDDAVDPGHTYHYIVQAKGTIDGDWFLLGTTEWVSVAVE